MVAVKIALDWTPNTNHAGFYIAQQQQLFAKAGLEVTIISPHNGGRGRQAGRQPHPTAVAAGSCRLCCRTDAPPLHVLSQHATTASREPAHAETRVVFAW